jgi:hypothetical protein
VIHQDARGQRVIAPRAQGSAIQVQHHASKAPGQDLQCITQGRRQIDRLPLEIGDRVVPAERVILEPYRRAVRSQRTLPDDPAPVLQADLGDEVDADPVGQRIEQNLGQVHVHVHAHQEPASSCQM